MNNVSATMGKYGAKPYSRTADHAKLLLEAIHNDLNDMVYFTRDDLLNLRQLMHVSTATRYHYIGLAVRYLVDTKKLMEMGRSDLLLPENYSAYVRENNLVDSYISTIDRLTVCLTTPFTVYDVVELWTTDPHISINTKRTFVRIQLRNLVRHGLLIHNNHTYTPA